MNADPKEFGKYKLIRKVGRGGMAELFLARHSGIEGFEKLIAIKRILPHLADSEEFVQMFLDEARLAAQLNHPNIVQIYDLGCVQGRYFLAMEYVNGVDLNHIIKKEANQGGRIPVNHAVKILSYVCEALTYAHSRKDPDGTSLGLVHRDVSPQNVLVSFDGGVKLTDFGIAKASTHVGKTRTGTLKGKYAYMSPEQCLGGKVDQRSDVFAVGILLYRMTTGLMPFSGSSEFSALHALVHRAPRPPTVVRENYPVGLLPVLERTLAKSPDDRYPDALSLQMALENFLIREKAVSNTALIGRYVCDLFPDAVTAQTRAEGDGKTDAIDGILSAIEIVEESTRSDPSTVNLSGDTPPGADEAGGPSDIHEKPTRPLVKKDRMERVPGVVADAPPVSSGSPRDSRMVIPAIVAAAFLSAVFGALLVVFLSRGEKIDQVRQETSDVKIATPAEEGGVDGGRVGVAAADPGVVPDAGVAEAEGESPGKTTVVSAGKKKRRKRRTPQPTGTGFLSINTDPWSQVWVAGKNLGLTPLAYKKLPAGRHRLRMRNKDLGIDKTIWIRIRPGETTVVNQTLHAK